MRPLLMLVALLCACSARSPGEPESVSAPGSVGLEGVGARTKDARAVVPLVMSTLTGQCDPSGTWRVAARAESDGCSPVPRPFELTLSVERTSAGFSLRYEERGDSGAWHVEAAAYSSANTAANSDQAGGVSCSLGVQLRSGGESAVASERRGFLQLVEGAGSSRGAWDSYEADELQCSHRLTLGVEHSR